MADRPDEKVEMKDLDPNQDDDGWDNDPPRPQYQETNLDEPGDITIDEGLSMDDTIPSMEFENMSEDDLEKMKQKGLENVFLEITGEPIEVKDNENLFKKSKITLGRKGHKTLWYDGKKIYYKTKGEYSKWTEYVNIALRNPMTAEFEKAKKNYEVSARKQTNDIAGVNLPKEISEDVIKNVLTEMFDELDLNTEFETVGTQAVDDTSTQTKSINVEKLQARLRTLDKIIDSQEKNFYKKHRVLNELRAKNANEDVISSKEQEINDLQDKLKKVKLEKDELLLDVNVSNELLNEANESLRELTQKNTEITEKFEQFKDTAMKEFKAQKSEIVNRYWQQQEYDKEQARQEYTEALSQAKPEFSEQIKKAEADKTKLEKELLKEKEKVKFLRQAEHKQHEKPSAPDIDLQEREVGGVFAGVMEQVDKINDAIDRLDQNDPDFEKLVTDNLKALEIQAKEFKQKAENAEGYEKQAYRTFEKFTEREIDKIKLKLDMKLEDGEVLEKLKEEVKENPGVTWERIKQWIKDNKWGVLSVTFGVGSFIASIIMAVRNAVKTVAKGVSTFGQSVVKVLKKLGPVFAALGSILMTALGILSQGLMFLANNLWILLVLFAMFLWKYLKKYFKKK